MLLRVAIQYLLWVHVLLLYQYQYKVIQSLLEMVDQQEVVGQAEKVMTQLFQLLHQLVVEEE